MYHNKQKSQMDERPEGQTLMLRTQQLADLARAVTAVSVPAKHPGQKVDRDVPLKGNLKE